MATRGRLMDRMQEGLLALLFDGPDAACAEPGDGRRHPLRRMSQVQRRAVGLTKCAFSWKVALSEMGHAAYMPPRPCGYTHIVLRDEEGRST